MIYCSYVFFFFSSRRQHTRCALVLEFRRVLFRSHLWHQRLAEGERDLGRSAHGRSGDGRRRHQLGMRQRGGGDGKGGNGGREHEVSEGRHEILRGGGTGNTHARGQSLIRRFRCCYEGLGSPVRNSGRERGARSEERRVGKEGVSKCRTRG